MSARTKIKSGEATTQQLAERLYAVDDAAQFSNLDKNALAIFKVQYTAIDEQLWANTKRYLSAINSDLKKSQIPFLIVPVPAPPQISAEEWKIGKLMSGLKADEMIVGEKMQDILKDFTRAEEIQYLDPVSALTNREGSETLFRLRWPLDSKGTEYRGRRNSETPQPIESVPK